MIRYFLFSCLLSSPFYALANLHQKLQLTQVTCGAKALSILQEWKAKDEWKLKFTENPEDKKFQAPTENFGIWAQVQYQKNESLKLFQFSAKNQTQVKFGADCKPEFETQAYDADRKLASTKTKGFSYFQDSEIQKLFQSQKSAIVYMWTPHMQVAVEGLREISKAAQKLKVPLYAVVDPNSNPGQVAKIAGELKISKDQIYYFDSFDLTMRDFRLHYPSLMIISRGKYATPVQRGLETSDIYENYIRTHL